MSGITAWRATQQETKKQYAREIADKKEQRAFRALHRRQRRPDEGVRILQHVNFVMKSGVVYKNETC